MTTFALIHGAWHRPAHWGDLVAELAARSHRAVAVDLPSEDRAADFSAYARVVTAAVDGEQDVVVVAHSLAGTAGALVAAARPVRRLVYLAAILPQLGHSLDDRFASGEPILQPGAMKGVAGGEDGMSRWVDADAAVERMYHDVDPDRARAAVVALRPQSRAPHAEPFPLDAFPEVAVTSIVCSDDRLMNNEWLRAATRERLGVDCVELEGGHSPMLARPAALADLLVAL